MTKTKKKSNIKNRQATSDNKSDIKAIIYIFTGILLAISTYTTKMGILSVFSRNVLYSFVGIITYIMPIYLIFFGINTIKSKGTIRYTRRFFSVSLIAIVIWLLCSTVNIQISTSSVSTINFFSALKLLRFSTNYSLHGGFIGYLFTYPLYKLLGYLGSYIIYVSLLIIGSILLMDITLYDIYQKLREIFSFIISKNNLKDKKKNNNNNIKATKKVNEEKISSNQTLEKEEFLKNINNKIQVLDFMKNSELHDIDQENDVTVDCIKNDNSKNISNNIYSSLAEKNIYSKNKEVINKEIEVGSYNLKDENEIKYIYPTTDLLKLNSKLKLKSEDKKDLIDSANKLEETLSNFGVEAKVIQVTKGPSVTRFELQPSPGVKVSKIVNLQDDIALGLAANGVRMEAPIPGKAAIGIEVPNKKQIPVLLREVLDSVEFSNSNNKIAFALGKDITGKCIVGDLSKMPHMLIAGATGSGKSVCINSLIISILYKYSPKDVKLLMVDPKVVELSIYNGIPNLLIPVVTDPKKAAGALNWAVNEMNNRYTLFSQMKVKNIESYNNLLNKGEISEKLPYIVIIVDELADLMMACPNDVEDYICRLAQMARAAGMHLIIATQRPSVDVITGVIKANIPSRVSFAVSSGTDSRTILDQVGAEKLLGRGDMLYYPIGENKPLRVQGAFISEEEVETVVDYIKEKDKTFEYSEELLNHINNETNKEVNLENETDELLDEAMRTVIQYQQASISFLQRKLRIGFNRASRIMDELEEHEIISAKDGSKPRQVLIQKEELYTDE